MSKESEEFGDGLVLKKYHYTCVYCGFDGRSFQSWRLISIDHIMPKACGGNDELPNKVVACHACNSMTSKMTFPKNMSTEQIFAQKRAQVRKSMKKHYQFWLKNVAPEYLSRPLPRLHLKMNS